MKPNLILTNADSSWQYENSAPLGYHANLEVTATKSILVCARDDTYYRKRLCPPRVFFCIVNLYIQSCNLTAEER